MSSNSLWNSIVLTEKNGAVDQLLDVIEELPERQKEDLIKRQISLMDQSSLAEVIRAIAKRMD
jgi:hypothetical protein